MHSIWLSTIQSSTTSRHQDYWNDNKRMKFLLSSHNKQSIMYVRVTKTAVPLEIFGNLNSLSCIFTSLNNHLALNSLVCSIETPCKELVCQANLILYTCQNAIVEFIYSIHCNHCNLIQLSKSARCICVASNQNQQVKWPQKQVNYWL